MAVLNFLFCKKEIDDDRKSQVMKVSEEEGEKGRRRRRGLPSAYTHTRHEKSKEYISNSGQIQTNLLPHLHFANYFEGIAMRLEEHRLWNHIEFI